MKSLLILLSLLLTSNATCLARLGDSKEALQAKYGPPEETQRIKDELTKIYRWNGYLIYVVFIDGRSEHEQYSKVDGGEFTNGRIQTILSANTLGSKWQSLPMDDPEEVKWEEASSLRIKRSGGIIKLWKLADGKSYATLVANTLIIETPKYRDSFVRIRRQSTGGA